VVSFALADNHRSVFNSAARYVKEMCNTIVHEAGHAFGLEHQFEFDDGKSACPDPMSYDIGICNPPKHFFRNKSAKCGGVTLTSCACGMRQNSHAKLDAAFGSKPSEVPNPTATVTFSGSPPGTLGSVVAGTAGSQRGVETVSLLMNGHVYATQGGAAYVGELGQPLDAQYTIAVPPDLPNSIYDLQFRACDDLGNCTDSAILTVTKGPEGGCTSTEACDTAQECLDGRCTFLPPNAAVGEDCEVNEQCLSGVCRGSATTKICTQLCNTMDDQCPDDLECQLPANETDPEAGVCFFPQDDGGCCSSSDAPPWGAGLLAFGMVGWLSRRRRAARPRA
jgi:MYXO-CTERM domain-containing protein